MTLQRTAWAVGLLALAFGANAQQAPKKTYIVQLADAPVASYTGTVKGYVATKPAPGTRLNVSASQVAAYIKYLDTKRSSVQATVPASDVLYQYKVVFNGFAAKMTDAEAAKMRATAGVQAVYADTAYKLDTTRTPAFLGLTAPGGLWSRTDASGKAVKGENIILGIIDNGVWPEDPSFSDKVDGSGTPISSHLPGTVVYAPLPAGQFTGFCQAGEGFNATMCNNKLVGAQYFNAGFAANGSKWAGTYYSPRDEDGHGSHTASTSGGNENVPAIVQGVPAGLMSGIAPRARIAAYKACYVPNVPGTTNPDQGTCYQMDTVKAIETAVTDGVDVINYSIGGSQTTFQDAVEVAFFNAAAAGVFVSASAGNSGPGNQVAHISPWITTVAASTHDRVTVATVTFGDGITATGPSFQTAGVPSTSLALSENLGTIPAASLTPPNLLARRQCYSQVDIANAAPSSGITSAAALDPALAAGKIVVCTRGPNVLVNKAQAVKDAGGVAMILQNAPGTNNSTLALPFVVPAVHLDVAYAAHTFAYAATASATAAIAPSVQASGVIAPVMADFSSRGPNKADPNVLKPDLTAPGVDIIAAYTNTSITPAQRDQIIAGTLIPGPGANQISGTSMSSPHVAGTAALLKQLHPTWSPSAIKSALLTSTNGVLLAGGAPDPDRWGYGAGHLNPNAAAATSLVYDVPVGDYVNYYFGLISGDTLNLPTITVSALLGSGSVTRTLVNKGTTSVTINASSSLPGFTTNVVPATLTIAPGASASYRVDIARTSAAVNTWAFGTVAWTPTGGAPVIRSPLTVRGSQLASPSEVIDNRAAGTKVFTIGTGYAGTLSVSGIGLVPATRRTGTIAVNGFQCYPVAVPAGATVARFALYDADTQGGSLTDLDLEVYRGSTFVGSSGSGTSDEMVTFVNPVPGAYQACVVGFAPKGPTSTYTLSTWVVGPAVGTQTMRAAGPPRVYAGGTASVGVSWAGATSNRYLGTVQYRETAGSGVLGTTIISVDNVPSSALASMPPVAKAIDAQKVR